MYRAPVPADGAGAAMLVAVVAARAINVDTNRLRLCMAHSSCNGGSSVTHVLRIKGQIGESRGRASPTGLDADCDGRQIMLRSNRGKAGGRGVQVGLLPT